IVLTAAHCLEGEIDGVDAEFSGGLSYPAVRYAIHPDYAPYLWPRSDVALLDLDGPVAGVTPLPIATVAPRPGARGTSVGFGEDEATRVGVARMGPVTLRPCPR